MLPTALGNPAKPARFPHSHRLDGFSLLNRQDQNPCSKPSTPRVGQIKMPNWAKYKYSCQTQKYGGTNCGNKLTLRQLKMNVRALLEDLQVSPIQELLKIARKRDTPAELVIRCYTEIARFAYPRLSAVAVSGELKGTFSHVVIQKIMSDPEHAQMADQLVFAMVEQENKLAIEGPPLEIEAGESNPLIDSEDEPIAELD